MDNTIYVIIEHGSLFVAGYVTNEREAKNYVFVHDDYFYFPVNELKDEED